MLLFEEAHNVKQGHVACCCLKKLVMLSKDMLLFEEARNVKQGHVACLYLGQNGDRCLVLRAVQGG